MDIKKVLLIIFAAWILIGSTTIYLLSRLVDINITFWVVVIGFYLVSAALFTYIILNNPPLWLVITISVLLVILIILTYLIWPFKYSLEVQNIYSHQLADVIIINQNEEIIFSDYVSELSIILPKGVYNISITKKGYEKYLSQVSNPIEFKWHKDHHDRFTLTPIQIPLSKFTFTDPTTTIKLNPKINVKGKNILGDYIDESKNIDDEVSYGDYEIFAFDENFERKATIKGITLFQNDSETNILTMNPNDKFYVIDEEANHITNFLKDYLSYSKQDKLGDANGYPSKFYIYKKDKVISLGKMLFLICQKNTYESTNISPIYFLPKDMHYEFKDSANDYSHCYSKALAGTIPTSIAKDSTQNAIYKSLTKKTSNFPYEIQNLNDESRGVDISFTFDVESGRYLPTKEDAISPCHDKNYAIGLTGEELICDDPAFVAWMTPRGKKITYKNYSYPQVSGILGFKQILDYSLSYGIPTTNFFVKKDVIAFETLDPEMMQETIALVQDGLIEVGSHTRYHSDFTQISKSTAITEIKESKTFLEKYFKTNVVGFRAPYGKIIDDPYTFASAVAQSGYGYYSQHQNYFGKVPYINVVEKPVNYEDYAAYMEPNDYLKKIKRDDYIINIDHPWNMVYKDGNPLIEDPGALENHRALMLISLSKGIIVKLEDLRLYKGITY